jgi:hypothetical protein
MRALKFEKIGKFFPQVFKMAVIFKMAENLVFPANLSVFLIFLLSVS